MQSPARRLLTTLIAILAVAAAQVTTSIPAAASTAGGPATTGARAVGAAASAHQLRGILPIRKRGQAAVRISRNSNPTCGSCVPPLIHQSTTAPLQGGVTGSPGHVTIVPVFWNAGGSLAYTTNYKSIIDTYVANVAADSAKNTNVFSVGTQYYQQTNTPANHLAYAISAGAELDDSFGYPSGGCTPDSGFSACVNDAQLVTELFRFLNASQKPIDDAHLYMVMFPQSVETCQGTGPASSTNACSTNVYCAYHSGSYNSANNNYLVYANEPFPALNGCADPFNGAQQPNGDAYADALLSSFSHEANESLTDVFGTWYDTNGNEDGDECAYTYGVPMGGSLSSHTAYNQVINGAHYYTQDEFSNEDFAAGHGDVNTPSNGAGGSGTQVLGCVQSEELPSVSFTPPAGVSAGVSASFSGSGSDADSSSPALAFTWNWGDGTPNSSGASTSHAFSAGGSYNVTLTVAEGDGDGWANSVTHAVNVAVGYLQLSAPPTSTAGGAFSVIVTARNSDATLNTGYTGTVRFTSSDGQAGLPANYSFTGGDAGVHTFTVTMRTAGNESVTATDTLNAGLTASATVAVSAAAAAHLALVAGTTQVSRVLFPLTVNALDAFGNTATTYAGTIHFASNDTAATLPGDATLLSGHGNFSAALQMPGPDTITATDTVSGSINGTTPSIADSPIAEAVSTLQYSLSNSDGATWQDMDPSQLQVALGSPVGSTTAVLSANADLWTANAGYNQDIAIFVSVNSGADQLLAWKESGGFAGTFSPNAAYLQTVYTMTGGSTYLFKLKWKTNRSAPGVTIRSGAGPIGGQFSPTRLTLQVVPSAASTLSSAVGISQYVLSNSDGATWQRMDLGTADNLSISVSPGSSGTEMIGGNSDLWTMNAGYNQDIAVLVSVDGGADQLVAWKESGGFAGTFSPNAAFVQGAYPVTTGHTYVFSLKWKTNRPASGATIRAGAGPIGGSFSPTRITAQFLPTASLATMATSNEQYTLTNSDGATWQLLDPTNEVQATVTPAISGSLLVGGNADLWTVNAGYNQDLAIFVSIDGGADQLVAWKESGGFAGTFSPNAAFVQASYPVQSGHTYVFKLEWKTNRPASGATIHIGAGPIAGALSPTRITVETPG